MGEVVRIPEEGDAGDARNEFLEELHSLVGHFRAEDGIASHVCARPRQARHESRPHGIANRDHHNRNRRGRFPGGSSCGATVADDDIDRKACEIPRDRGEPIGLPLGRPIFEDNIPAFDVTKVAQFLPEVIPDWCIIDDADERSLRRSMLRARRERPSSNTAEKRDEIAPPDHSITSSAIESMSCETLRPSALAVLRLMTSSIFVTCCTGRSAGFSPLRIRTMYRAD